MDTMIEITTKIKIHIELEINIEIKSELHTLPANLTRCENSRYAKDQHKDKGEDEDEDENTRSTYR